MSDFYTQLNQVIKEYTDLAVYVDVCAAQGQRPDPKAVIRMDAIDNAARASLSPSDFHQVEMAVTQGKAEMVTQAYQVHEAEVFDKLDTDLQGATRDMTNDGQGLTVEQYHQARQHGAYVQDNTAHQSNTIHADRVKGVYEATGRDVEKDLDTAEYVVSLIRDNKDKQANKVREKAGMSWNEIDAAKEFGMNYEMAKRSAKHEVEEVAEIVEIDENDARRLDVMDSVAWSDMDGDFSNTPLDEENIHESYIERNEDENGDDRRADIAAAFE
tara:strand:- start:45 stop:857 length:813 start_codon:yes stop_codon:yes gene_type:complete